MEDKKSRIARMLLENGNRSFTRQCIELMELEIDEYTQLLIYCNTMRELVAAQPMKKETMMTDINYILQKLNSRNAGEFTADCYVSLYLVIIHLRTELINKRAALIAGN